MKSAFLLFSLFTLLVPKSWCFSNPVDRTALYAALKSENLDSVNNQLKLIEQDESDDANAFEGALLMKKAGLVKSPFKKLKYFKQGHALLEAALKKDGDNPEFRFLRLMIQENAPGIVNYKKDIESDSALIQTDFKNMPKELQDAVLDYSKRSKVLAAANFET